MNKTLTLAIQKSGRLHEGSLKILREAGLVIENGIEKLKVEVSGFPLQLLFLRSSDIPRYVLDKVADIAILGENEVLESEFPLTIHEKLGFARCRLSIAVPKDVEYHGTNWLYGKRIATSYPRMLEKYLNAKSIQAEIHEISGSVEIAPHIGLADAVCDLVSTGGTLFSNGLREVETILHSQACLVSSQGLSTDKLVILDKLLFRIRSVLRASNSKYILLNVPNERIAKVSALLPVLKSPTILPLAEPGWSSLHSVIHEDTFWNVIDDLKEAGAEGILIIPIEKIVL